MIVLQGVSGGLFLSLLYTKVDVKGDKKADYSVFSLYDVFCNSTSGKKHKPITMLGSEALLAPIKVPFVRYTKRACGY